MTKAEIIKQPVENVSSSLKRSAWAAIIESLVTAILGILLIAWPDTVVKIIAYVAGVFFVVKGLYQIILYFMVKGQNDFFNNGLLYGVISVLVGIIAFVMGGELANVLCLIIGIWLVYESLVRMSTSLKLHAAGMGIWKYVLLLALIMLAMGLVVVFYKGEAVIMLCGWMMIASGIIGIIGDVMFIQQVNELTEKLAGKKE